MHDEPIPNSDKPILFPNYRDSGHPMAASDLERAIHLQMQLLDAVEQSVIATDLNGTILFWNQSADQLYGWSASEVLGRNIMDVTVGGETHEHAAEIMTAVGAGATWQGEFMVRRRDGSRFLARVTDAPIVSEDGTLIGMIGLSRDLTSRKELEVELREQKDTLKTVHHIGMLLSAELDLDKLLQAITDAATELSGAQFGSFFYNVRDRSGDSYMLYTLSGVPRKHFENFPMPRATDLFGPTFRAEGVVRIGDVKRDPRYGRNSPYFGMPPGHLPVTSYLAVPVVSRSGSVLGGIFLGHPVENVFTERMEVMVVALAAQAAIAIDNAQLYQAAQSELTERKQAELEMQRAKEAAETASRAKDHLLSMLSHELRAPLTPVLTAVHVLETDENLPTEFRPFIDIIHRNIELEARLIDDLLDLTNISKGTLRLNRERVDFHPLIEHVVDIVEEDIRDKGLRLSMALEAPKHTVIGDSGRLQQVLWNLVRNAIKFTTDGGSIAIETSNRSDGSFICEVSDTGIGIEPELISELFSAFEQAEKTISRKYGGLGLGLAISRKIIELHDGNLTAKSDGRDRGARFICEVPGAE